MSTLVSGGAEGYNFEFNFVPLTQGVSDLAKKTSDVARAALDHFTKTMVNKNPKDRLKDELETVFYECRKQGWDGYDAIPLNQMAIKRAIEYISSLPKKIPIPEVTPEPDGEVALEWYGNDKSVFSISFGESDTISYAGLFSDGTKTNGVGRVDSSNKKIFEEFISRVFSS